MDEASGHSNGGVVRALHAPTPGEVAAENFRQAIFRGEYAPGRIVALPEIAERSGCHLPVLLAYLRQLEHDNLITIRHDAAMVRPLDSDELRSAYRMLLRLQFHTTEAAIDACSDAELEEFDTTYPTAPRGTTEFRAQLLDCHLRRNQILHGEPRLTIERVVTEPIRNTLRRHFAPVPGRPPTDGRLLETFLDLERQMGEVVRTRRWAPTGETLLRCRAASEEMGHQIVELSRDPEAKREHARIIQFKR